MRARTFAQAKYGISTNTVENSVTVSTTPVRVLINNPNRLSAILSNIGSENVFISTNSSVTATSGIQLPADGGVMSTNYYEDFDQVTRNLYAIAASGSTTIHVIESESLAHNIDRPGA